MQKPGANGSGIDKRAIDTMLRLQKTRQGRAEGEPVSMVLSPLPELNVYPSCYIEFRGEGGGVSPGSL